jgi:hypothetical protein
MSGGLEMDFPEKSRKMEDFTGAQVPAAGSSTRLLPPYVFGASVVGPLHVQKSIPCQDACAFESLPPESAVIAVADGLGSASRSDIGATEAVRVAVQTAKEMILGQQIEESKLGGVVRAAVASARKAIEDKAIEEQCSVRDLACTIIVVAIRGDSMTVAHIGDGAVVASTVDGLRIISPPGESEYANEVVPLTSKDWEESLRIVPLVTGVQCLGVFTDGCQRAALRKSADGLQPFDRFLGPIFSFAQELEDLAEGEEEIRALLSSQKICDNSEDDKTLILAVVKKG